MEAAAVEIAALAADADGDAFEACLPIAERLVALPTGCAGDSCGCGCGEEKKMHEKHMA
jgi:hypothetical protein